MARRSIGIVMNGVTGRMGYRQHLVRSILALREQGGLALADGTVIWPEPVLVGRNAEKLKNIAERHQLENWTTDLDSALADPVNEVYFDAQSTKLRAAAVRQALVTGMHVYVEKPVAATLPEALELARLAREAGLKNGVVQDKLLFQHRAGTPKPVWDPDIPNTEPFRDQWQPVPDNAEFGNGFKTQWELFLAHVVSDAPFPYDLLAGARGVQLAELGLASSPAITRAVLAAGYRGLIEVEIFNQAVWDTPGEQTLRTVIDRHRRYLSGLGTERPGPC